MEAHILLADPLVLTENATSGAAVTHSFSLLQFVGNGSVRHDLSPLNAESPNTMKVSHTKVGKGNQARTRHLVRLEAPVFDGDNNLVANMPAALYLVADIPDAYDTSLQKARLWKFLVGLVRGGSGITAYDTDVTKFYNRWLAGES